MHYITLNLKSSLIYVAVKRPLRIEKWFSLWLSRMTKLGLVLLLLSVANSPLQAQISEEALASTPDNATDALAKYGSAIIDVYYQGDKQLGRNLASVEEPMKVDYENRVVTFIVTEDTYEKVKEYVEQFNGAFTLEYDREATWQYIVRPMTVPYSSVNQQLQISSTSEKMVSALSLPSYNGIPGFPCYHTVEEAHTAGQYIATNYPNIATWVDIGDSWEKQNGLGGYDIFALKLTNSAIAGPKPKLILSAAVHAREYTPAELAIRFADLLVDGYGVDADITWILDYHEIHIILQGNPDGRKQAETGILWRKNANQNYCSPTSTLRGADLNRNFEFQYGGSGSSTNQCSTIYRGAFAGSEPETQAIQNYLTAELIDQRPDDLTTPAPMNTTGMYLDMHSSGELILPPWGFNPGLAPPNQTEIFDLSRKHAFYNGHSVQPSGSSNSGTTKDFGYGKFGVPSYTLELGTEFFEQCSVFENSVLPGNLDTLLYAAKTVRTPYITSTGPDTINLALSSSVIPPGTPIDLSALSDDTRYNTSTGSVATQNISAAEYYIDVPPWESSAVPNGLSATDGSFNSGVENITASISTTGLSDGQHTLFVRSQDSGGTWGAVSAIYFTVDSNAQVPVDIFSDDFESSSGWLTDPNNTDTATTGQWEVANPEQTATGSTVQQLGTTVSGQFDLVTAGAAGAGLGSNDIDNGVTSVLSPDITIPVGTTNLDLSFWYYLAHLNNATTADFLRVTVIGSASSTVVFEELGSGDTDVGSWEQTTVNIDSFSGQTINILIEAADGGGGSLVEEAIDDIRLIGILPSVNNQAPIVNAGVDNTITLPSTATLSGSVTDDGLPNPPANVTTTWSVVSGPGIVTFANPSSQSTTASFSTDGLYVLRLSADDGDQNGSDDVEITVNPEPPANVVPTVNAGPNQTIILPNNVSLSGSASDDGLPNPPASITTTWSLVSGPGTVSFANANALNTSASFSTDGVYILRLIADDTELLGADDVQITVNPEPPTNVAPTVNAGSNQTITLPSTASLSGSVSDDGLPNPPASTTTTWSVVSGPGTVSFASANALNTSASFSTDGVYVLRLSADDSALSSSDDVQVTVNPQPPTNDAPTVNAGSNQTIILPNIVSLSGSASDDGLPNPPASITTAWSLVSGPGSVSFANANSLNTNASFSTSGVYVLRLTADDSALSSSDDVQITVDPEPSSGVVYETGIVSASSTWQTISLGNTYSSMVVVASVVLPSQSSSPVVTRVRNASGNSFQLKIQNPSGTSVSGYNVHYLAIEEGVYTVAQDGVKMEAVKTISSVTAQNNDWNSIEPRAFQNSYTTPVVVGQVMTEVNSEWSVFWASSSTNRRNPVTSTSFAAGKHVAEDPNANRNNETIGYVVFETGNSTLNTASIYAARSSDNIRGTGNNSSGYTAPVAGVSNAAVTLVSSNAMDGGDGGWPVLFGSTPLTNSQIRTSIDEDQLLNSERNHTTEQISYVVIGNP